MASIVLDNKMTEAGGLLEPATVTQQDMVSTNRHLENCSFKYFIPFSNPGTIFQNRTYIRIQTKASTKAGKLK